MEKKILPILLRVVFTYVLTLVFAVVFISLFIKFYDIILNDSHAGYGLFYGRSDELWFGAIIFALTFFLPLFVFLLNRKKLWLIWLFGISIPALIIFSEGKHMFWFLIFTLAGALLGWLIKFIYEKYKK